MQLAKIFRARADYHSLYWIVRTLFRGTTMPFSYVTPKLLFARIFANLNIFIRDDLVSLFKKNLKAYEILK